MSVTEKLLKLLEQCEYTDVTDPQYHQVRYPKILPVMNFEINQYHLKGFGQIMNMNSTAMKGLMKLTTIALTPNEGGDVPFLLIDCMEMKNKLTVFVEYYDCTGKHLDFPVLNQLKEKYASISDYSEKPAWYISERMNCSLIKAGDQTDKEVLEQMVEESMREYLKLALAAPKDENNLTGLKAFRKRMIEDGNPASSTMDKVLGKKGSIIFFEKIVMPI